MTALVVSAASYSLFETALGWGGIAWTDAGIEATSFPEAQPEKVRHRLRIRIGAGEDANAPQAVQNVVADIQRLLAGEPVRFDDAPLIWKFVPDFDRRVLQLARAIGPGETRTYGDLARALGDVALARRVGQALGRNPFPIVVPCHRVLGADGRLTGFSAPGGAAAKERLLKIEGALAPSLFD